MRRYLLPDSVTGIEVPSHLLQAVPYERQHYTEPLVLESSSVGPFSMHTDHRICTRPPCPCDIGTSRIFLALDQEFYGFQNVLQSLCYGGHEALVALVVLEVIVAIFACHQQDSPRFGTGHPFLDANCPTGTSKPWCLHCEVQQLARRVECLPAALQSGIFLSVTFFQ